MDRPAPDRLAISRSQYRALLLELGGALISAAATRTEAERHVRPHQPVESSSPVDWARARVGAPMAPAAGHLERRTS
jgi:hypothetical protein